MPSLICRVAAARLGIRHPALTEHHLCDNPLLCEVRQWAAELMSMRNGSKVCRENCLRQLLLGSMPKRVQMMCWFKGCLEAATSLKSLPDCHNMLVAELILFHLPFSLHMSLKTACLILQCVAC